MDGGEVSRDGLYWDGASWSPIEDSGYLADWEDPGDGKLLSPDGGRTHDPGVRVTLGRFLPWGVFVAAVIIVILGMLYAEARGNARDRQIREVVCPPGMELSQEEFGRILDQREARGEEPLLTPELYACLQTD